MQVNQGWFIEDEISYYDHFNHLKLFNFQSAIKRRNKKEDELTRCQFIN